MVHNIIRRSWKLFGHVQDMPEMHQVSALRGEWSHISEHTNKNLFESDDAMYRATIIQLERNSQFSVHPLEPKLESLQSDRINIGRRPHHPCCPIRHRHF
jgi:hypothetical protein